MNWIVILVIIAIVIILMILGRLSEGLNLIWKLICLPFRLIKYILNYIFGR